MWNKYAQFICPGVHVTGTHYMYRADGSKYNREELTGKVKQGRGTYRTTEKGFSDNVTFDQTMWVWNTKCRRGLMLGLFTEGHGGQHGRRGGREERQASRALPRLLTFAQSEKEIHCRIWRNPSTNPESSTFKLHSILCFQATSTPRLALG